MKKTLIRMAAGVALTAFIISSIPSTEVLAASNSIFPAAGGALAAGQGTSIRDIRANAARNAAKNLAVSTHNAALDSSKGSLDVKKASLVSSSEDAEETNDTLSVASPKSVPALIGSVEKVETPSSKAVNESVTVNGVSVVGSASEAAHIEVTEIESDMTVDAEGSSAAAPSIEVQPDIEVADGEEDLTRTVIAIADPFVNVRDIASEDGEVVGKLYNHSAGTWLGKEGDWYKIESGNVTGYVKGEFVVTGQEAVDLAAEVGERVAVVTTTTLKIRAEASTDSTVLGMVPMEDRLTVVEETDEWAKVSIEEGDGWVSKEFVTISTEFPKAESAAEEAARLKKEEEDRRKANAAAQKASKKNNAVAPSGGGVSAPVSVSGSGLGSQVASFACQFVGNPYVYGGTSLTNGTDCSGFTSSVYRNFGVSLPHSSGAQRSCGYGVGSLAEAMPGDIICYSGHVGIYIGGGQIVHASTAATGIKISNAGYRSILAIRRIF